MAFSVYGARAALGAGLWSPRRAVSQRRENHRRTWTPVRQRSYRSGGALPGRKRMGEECRRRALAAQQDRVEDDGRGPRGARPFHRVARRENGKKRGPMTAPAGQSFANFHLLN